MATGKAEGLREGIGFETQRSESSQDFSLVLGGPLYQLLLRTRLSGKTLELTRRRVAALIILTWLPLLVLSLSEGTAWGGVMLPFLYDVEIHVRFLIALPLLVVAELVVHQRMRSVVMQFLERRLVPESEIPKFEAAVVSAIRMRNSVLAELSLIVLVVFGVGSLWRGQIALDLPSWYGTQVQGQLSPSAAGWWLGLVSLSVFQFLLLRWYYRIFIWARFLRAVSRLDLDLRPMHPDRCGGVGFLGAVAHAFTPLLLAQGAVLSGMMANRIFFSGATLPEFKLELAGLVTVILLIVLTPLLAFSLKLHEAKRKGLREHGALAQRYVREYDQKWLRGSPDEPLVGSADIQSLADLGNSFEVVKEMKWAPFYWRTVVQLTVVTLLPVLPLTLTMISPEELLDRLMKILF